MCSLKRGFVISRFFSIHFTKWDRKYRSCWTPSFSSKESFLVLFGWSFTTMAALSEKSFKDLTVEEIVELLKGEPNKNTQKSTRGSRLIFDAYLQEKGIRNPTTAEELATILRKFYAEARRKDGNFYTKTSLCAIKFGLSRHFKQVLNVDITKDVEFNEANRVYAAQCAELKRQGLEKTGTKALYEHIPPIDDKDIKKLYLSGIFSTKNPTTLQNKVFFEIILFFGRRGSQLSLRQLKKNDFEVKINSQGKRCVVKVPDHRADNVQAGERGIMIAIDSPFCPVFSLEKYLSHLNPFSEFLFQRPKSCGDGQVWYDNMVIGENTLGKKMKVISQQAELSIIYSNYSIRLTTSAILDMLVSDLRNESSNSETDFIFTRTSRRSRFTNDH